MNPTLAQACRDRDIAIIFRLLVEGGLAQREIAQLTKMNQSEVSEIIVNGRRVQAYDVLVRVADGLGIPRGAMGLAYAIGKESPPPEEEVDEDVERRKLFALAGAILFGQPIFGLPEALAVGRVLMDPPRRVGMSDVTMYGRTLMQLQDLQRRVGGRASREPLSATALAGERLLEAESTPEVHQQLRLLVSDAHRRAGWAAGDIGLIDTYRPLAVDLAKSKDSTARDLARAIYK